MTTIRLAVAGAGLIGLRHIEAIRIAENVELAAIVDPADAARETAGNIGVSWFASLEELIATGECDGVILALPNQLHAEAAMACVTAGLPAIVEKPLTTDVASGTAVVAEAKARGVPLLTGHHRRHNPLVRKAVEVISSGALGQLTAVQATAWLKKPDEYFNAAWRRHKGAGPVYLNLIHDIDLLHAFCGPVAEVQAMESNAVRGHEVEETAVILLRFESGLLGTVNVCDAAAAPWSWELTARENPHYAATSENCYLIAGTKGSLALPNLALWQHGDESGWWGPIGATRLIFDFEDPLVAQIRQFAAVIRGDEAPVVSAADGLAALKVIEAVKRAAAGSGTVRIADI